MCLIQNQYQVIIMGVFKRRVEEGSAHPFFIQLELIIWYVTLIPRVVLKFIWELIQGFLYSVQLKSNSWLATRARQILNTWPQDSKWFCAVNCSLGTGFYLMTHKLNMGSRIPLSNGKVYTGVAWADLEGTSKVHGLTFIVPAPTSLPPFFEPCLWAHGHLAEEGKAWAWFINGLDDILAPTRSIEPLNYGPTS